MDATREEVYAKAIPLLAPVTDIDIMLFAELDGNEKHSNELSGYHLVSHSLGNSWVSPSGYVAGPKKNQITDKVWL